MPSDGRKSLSLPPETYDRFLDHHEETRPNERAPYWHTVNKLLDLYEESRKPV